MSVLTLQPKPALPQTLRSIAAASITANYQVVGSIFGSGISFLWIRSSLNADVTISFDGVNDWASFPAGGNLVLDARSDLIPMPGQYGIFVKGAAATGSLFISTLTAGT